MLFGTLPLALPWRVDNRSVKKSMLQGAVCKIGQRHFSATQVRAEQIGTAEIRVPQIGPAQVCVGKHRIAKVCPP